MRPASRPLVRAGRAGAAPGLPAAGSGSHENGACTAEPVGTLPRPTGRPAGACPAGTPPGDHAQRPAAGGPAPLPDGPSPRHLAAHPQRAAAYLLLPDDPTRAAAMRAELVALQRTQGIPFAVYEELPEHRRRRPKRRRLLRRARRDGFDIVCVLRLRHLAPTRARVAQLVLGLGVPVVTPSGLRLDPADRVVRWVARERTDHGRKITRALDAKRARGERVGAIPSGFKLAEDGVHLVPDDNTRRAMATARELVAQGLSLREIGVKLTEAGHRTRRGGPITHKQVRRWLGART
jgi:DNA invertase Pin-like site-specific DNA recombinase